MNTWLLPSYLFRLKFGVLTCILLFLIRKRWHLFPPEDTPFLYPTRIPYEESSVFSKVNVVNPDLKRFPQFRKARRHMVTLSPGQVLFVPRHWWHYVESIDPVTVSVNSWIELEEDHQARVEEAITRTLVCALKTAEDPHNTRAWLNPTEVGRFCFSSWQLVSYDKSTPASTFVFQVM